MKWFLSFLIAAALGLSYVYAQTVPAPQGTAAMVCANNTVVPAPASGKFFYVQCDSTGKLITNASVSDMPDYVAGNWYLPYIIVATSNGQAPGAGSIRLVPMYLKSKLTINNLGVNITTASAGGNVQAAIYANNPATGRPTGTALVTTGNMATDATGAVSSTVNIQLNPGLYWFATNSDNSTVTYISNGSTSPYQSIMIGSTSLSNTAGMLSGLSVTQTFGTWPNLTSASFTELSTSQRIPLVFFRVGSVP